MIVFVDCAERTGRACSDRIGFLRMTLVSALRRTSAQCALLEGLSRRESDKNFDVHLGAKRGCK